MERMDRHERVGLEFVWSAAWGKGILLFTAPQFLSRGQRRKDLLNLSLRVTMQAVRGIKNAPSPSRETVSGKGVGAFLTTGATTDGGVPHGDLISKEQRKESETERKSL